MAPSTIQGGIPWDLLIEFAREKKAEEEQTGLPALLDKQQTTAISSLISLIPEPDVTEGNWISALSEYCQQNTHPLPHWLPSETFSIMAHGVRLQRSRVSCHLSWCNQTFPQEGFGYEAGQDPPTFKHAKQAKQFAAMQAYNYIQTTRGDKRPASTTQGSPSRTRVKAEEDNSDGGVSTTAAPPQTSGPSSSAILIRERVALLAGQMNYGIPEYFIEQDGETWRGRPIFRNDGRIPEGVGAVSGHADRQQAEDAVAEKVLEWLDKELLAKEALLGKTTSQI
ncbi:uncharacterized protein NECHADRAFT_100143 [Fusarium vanettenii 77-13-4]|uniref:DRBM domain-containing protein n=1 Tax=Fusarium vanettenii (strain ATCC MYA-4622 / CBS 123669 / FGSC 9596 / NRRL 45880 / 77-13-4) TaxID=660122 RepID=C7YQS2_FUSV7|nr:uncharacterized protein NECHADRAFT_100143 [Fusarium vanettenii 77-13-4]EEU46071.1 hypothetical protein NECHADRAFT_100143 [Fusarium vanettenii 77-13-4]